jgi:2-polyprenyl-3-methyl-5-hydroxy-6-metoxy-1,4-benzoquinol methylase
MNLNLGCSDRAVPDFVGVDIAPGPCVDQIADLSLRWPWDENSVDEVKAFDIIEHIADRIHFMNELHRVLRPGGQAHIEVPNSTKGAGFAQDPTHVSHWCMNSFQYFRAGSFAHQRLSKAYGITAAFHVLELSERMYQDEFEEVWKITAILETVK